MITKKGLALFGLTKYIVESVFGSASSVGSRYKPQAVADKLLAHAKTL